MGHDKDKPIALSPEITPPPSPAGSPFSDTTIDWDSELEAWGASLPLGSGSSERGRAPEPDMAPPPDADKIEFSPDDMASGELTVTGVAPPAFDEPVARVLPEIDERRAGDVRLQPAAAAVEALAPPDDSGILIIPDVEQLERAAASADTPPSAGETTDLNAAVPSDVSEPIVIMPVEPEAGRGLSADDGLPELSGVFVVEEAGEVEQVAGREAPPDLFDAEPPDERPASLDAIAQSPLPEFLPADLFAALATGAVLDPVDTSQRYWRDQVAAFADELVTARAAEAPDGRPDAVQIALAGARAAERGGLADEARRFYDDALALEPGCRAALRGHLRLCDPMAAPHDARSLLAALAAGPDGEAHRVLLEHWDLVRPDGVGSVPPQGFAVDERTGPAAALAAAERALRARSPSAAAAALMAAARALDGPTGGALAATAARLLEIDGGDAATISAAREEAGRLEPAHPGHLLAELRRAARLAPTEALAALDQALELPAAPALRAAVLRWTAALARALGLHDDAAERLARAARAWPGGRLPRRDRLDIAARLVGGGTSSAPDYLNGLSGDERILLALRLAPVWRAEGRDLALRTALEAALEEDPTAVPLALIAEELAATARDPAARAEALRLWASGDPARRAMAQVLRARALEATSDQAGVIEALRLAAAAHPLEPAFWPLAWRLLDSGDGAAAATALEQGAAGWQTLGGEPLVPALRERAAEVRSAASAPDRIAAALPAGPAQEDDPGQIAARMLDPDADPAAIARALTASAPPGVSHRVLEAAGWMLQAGDGREALAWLLPRWQQGPRLAPATALVRRLSRHLAEPAARAALLGELVEIAASSRERLVALFHRAEALEQAGDRPAAAAAYRELLASELPQDADLGLRRVLWSVRDGRSLLALTRDEVDARQGAGLVDGAIDALTEQARICRELLDDEAGARAALAAAAELGAVPPESELAGLLEACRDGRWTDVVTSLETLARHEELNPASLLTMAALLDEARAGGHRTNDLLAAAATREGAHPSLAPLVQLLSREPDPETAISADLIERLAQLLGSLPQADGRAIATVLVQAADLRQAQGAAGASLALLRAAAGHDPDALVPRALLRRALVHDQDWTAAADAAESEATAALALSHQVTALLTAAVISETRLGDRARAIRLLGRILEVDPRDEEAFSRLRRLHVETSDNAGLAALLAARLRAADPEEATALRLERARLLAGPLANREAGKQELRALLAEQPQHVEALSRLGDLEFEDGAFAVAAELFIRQARFDKDPERLRTLFLRIGRIYSHHLPDTKLAIGAFERVLRIDPGSIEALEALSELHVRQSDARRAIAVTEPLLEREQDPQRRLALHLRLATQWERLGDARRAGVHLRKAADESPRNLQAVGELARHYERSKDLQGRNILLDRSLAHFADDLRANPANLEALRALIPLYRWRHRPACATAAAQLLAVFTGDPAERAEALAAGAPPLEGRRLAPLANPALDERAFPVALPSGVRSIMRLLGPALGRAYRPSLRRWDVGRTERVPAGAGPRVIVDAIAADLGLRTFELYVSAARPRTLAVEPGEPPALILGNEIAALGPTALRAAGGYQLRLVQTHFDLLAAGSPEALGILLAGVVRQFVPDFAHPDLPDAEVSAAAAHISRALSRGLRNELAPFAAEIAAPFALGRLHLAVQETAARAALLASGDLATTLQLLFLTDGLPLSPGTLLGSPLGQALVDFALSEDHDELVSALDAVS